MPFHDDIWGNKNSRARQAMTRAMELGKKSLPFLLPDSCTITPAVGENKTVSIKGIPTWDTPIARTYLGSSIIPCRADPVRSFRPDEISGQVSQVDEIDLQLPIDMAVAETDIINLNGNDYKIRKLNDDSVFAFMKVAKIMRLGVSLD